MREGAFDSAWQGCGSRVLTRYVIRDVPQGGRWKRGWGGRGKERVRRERVGEKEREKRGREREGAERGWLRAGKLLAVWRGCLEGG
jgi:hypothetical protein